MNVCHDGQRPSRSVLAIMAAGVAAAMMFACGCAAESPESPRRISAPSGGDPGVFEKPVVYLYPTEPMEVDVSLSSPERLTSSYPKYDGGWHVSAFPGGTLSDDSGRTYYALFYEAEPESELAMADGWCIAASDVPAFLEEKLSALGLNEREADEMIMYWLPMMQEKEYCLVRFAEPWEIDDQMALDVSPVPDSVIRVLMEICPGDEPRHIEEQQLPETPERDGFTLVEWGGTVMREDA